MCHRAEFVRVADRTRTALWTSSGPTFAKAERAAAVAHVDAQLAVLAVQVHARATHLEVCLVDLGTVLKHAYASDEP